MAIAALHQALIHLVVEGHAEGRLHVRVALEAERGLRRLQQLLFVLARVNAVAADAAHIRFCMRRALKIRMCSRMAAQALFIHFLSRVLCGIKDFGYVAAAVNVGLACAVAVLAGHTVAAVHLRHLGVRIVGKLLAHLFMAGDASLGPNEVAR